MNIHKNTRDRIEMRRGISLLPNLLTSCNLFAGFYSIVASVNGDFSHAALAIVVSAIFDFLDGKVARLTRTTSELGLQYDSLSDMVAFGVAPMILVYLWALQPFHRLGWAVCFLYLACGALRLARFNVSALERDPRFSQGLTITSSAGMVVTSFLLFEYLGQQGQFRDWFILVMAIILSFLMVSNFMYFSLKTESKKNRTFTTLVMALPVLALIIVQPQITLFVVALAYILCGPVVTGIYAWHHRREYDLEL